MLFCTNPLLITVNMCTICFIGDAILQLQHLNYRLFLLEWSLTPQKYLTGLVLLRKHIIVERGTKFKTDIQVHLDSKTVRRNSLSVVMSLNASS